MTMEFRTVRRIVLAAAAVAVVATAAVLARRRRPHLPAAPAGVFTARQPLLIVNPHSGSGKAQKYGVVEAARDLGIDAVEGRGHKHLASLAKEAIKAGCDHLLVGGGDGSLASVAQVAIKHDVPMSVVPIGTRNHFAMDLGLDRDNPLEALQAAFDGIEVRVDVGRIGKKRIFLNNVSFGLYAEAIADPDYRSHRTKSVADATVDTIEHPDSGLSVTRPDGTRQGDIEMLLASNNPYSFIGPPDFAGRASLDTGLLGVILADRPDRDAPRSDRAAMTRWNADSITVDSTEATVPVGVDGSLRMFDSPVAVGVDAAALRIVLPWAVAGREFRDEPEHATHEALEHLGAVRQEGDADDD
jgi:diacylglycerol kinase family enzyme